MKYSEALSSNNLNPSQLIAYLNDSDNINTVDFFYCFYVNNFLLQNYNNGFNITQNTSLQKTKK